VPQPLDIFQPDTAGQHVVRQVEYMIGFVIRQMYLQQRHLLVDPLGQAELGNQPVYRGDAAETGRVDVPTDLVGHRTRAEHRGLLLTPMPGQCVPSPRPAGGGVPRSAGSARAISSAG
jgi:hypothetical protein